MPAGGSERKWENERKKVVGKREGHTGKMGHGIAAAHGPAARETAGCSGCAGDDNRIYIAGGRAGKENGIDMGGRTWENGD